MELMQYSTADQIYPVAPDYLTQESLLTLYPDGSGGGGGGASIPTPPELYTAPAPVPVSYTAPVPDPVFYTAPDPVIYTAPAPDPGQDLFSPSIDPGTIAPSDAIESPAEQLIQQTGTAISTDTAGDIDAVLQFKDRGTKQDLLVNGQLIDNASGEVLSTIVSSSEANIQTSGVPAHQLRVVFVCTGYKTVDTTLDVLMQSANPIQVYFDKVAKLPWVEIAALFALVAFARKKKKQVGAVTFDDVKPWLYIGGGLLAFSIVRKTLEALGIWKSKATITVDQAVNDPNSFWNPNFWTTIKPAGAAYTFAWTWDQAAAVCKTIYEAFGWFGDDETAVKGAFRQCRTQANASYLCYVFNQTYKLDLLGFLRNGTDVAFWNGLSDTDIAEINNYISGLPKY